MKVLARFVTRFSYLASVAFTDQQHKKSMENEDENQSKDHS